jgi:heme/copper-type cytochrome/quinol oxidase subunit 2
MALVNYDQKPIFDMSLTEMLDAEFIDKKKRITSRDWEIFYRGIMDHKPYVHYSVTFDSVMVATEDLEDGAKRLLDVTSYTVLPVAAPIKMLITSADVLHS